MLGDAPLFHVAISAHALSGTGPLPYAAAATWPIDIALGAIVGAVAALYNRLILAIADASERIGPHPVEAHAALVGAAVGIVAWIAPELRGQRLRRHRAAARRSDSRRPQSRRASWCVTRSARPRIPPSPLEDCSRRCCCWARNWDSSCGTIASAALPGLGIDPLSFAVVGMAAFFVGVVRAPVTGIVLVIEMTAAFTSLLPMLAASFAAMLVAQWMGSAPIYDSLRSRMLHRPLPPRAGRP